MREDTRFEATLPSVSWFLYIVECEDGSLYTGIAVDPQARFDAHMAGKGARYTRSHRPLRLLASVALPDRSTASKAEYLVKQLPAGEKRRLATSGFGPIIAALPVAENP
jgi:putative endonuclease